MPSMGQWLSCSSTRTPIPGISIGDRSIRTARLCDAPLRKGCSPKPHILQVGLRGQLYGPDDMDYAREHKIRVITSEELHEHGLRLVRSKLKAFQSRKTYLSLDIDVVDPAFAPGTGTPQVGGLSSAQILDLVRELKGLNLVGCDLVEVSPPYDSAEITSLLAANLLFEQLCLLALR